MARSSEPRRQKIGILTFHRCINYGSYWQARCLVEGLRARGHDAVLLDHRNAEVTWREYRCAFQPTLPERTPRALFPAYADKARKVLEAVDALPLSPPFELHTPEDMQGFDTIIVGSDEVWNMRHPWYGGKAAFYGWKLGAARKVSYAASFGNHDAAEGLDPWWAELLGDFDAISVRDDNSREMVRASTGEEPALVLDPCLQFPPEPVEAEGGKPYVALYGHSFPDWFGRAVRDWARARGLRLVSIGYRNPHADEERIDAGPLDFARLIAGASAVATNFFHGCVFSLLNEKPFACATTPYRANKLRDLVRKVGAEPHLIEEDRTSELDTLLGQPLDGAIPRRIAALREQSDRFLAYALA